jgi:hypothetical protein
MFEVWELKKATIFALPFNKSVGNVAQLVEQRTENPCVDGSIPFVPTSWEKPRKS